MCEITNQVHGDFAAACSCEDVLPLGFCRLTTDTLGTVRGTFRCPPDVCDDRHASCKPTLLPAVETRETIHRDLVKSYGAVKAEDDTKIQRSTVLVDKEGRVVAVWNPVSPLVSFGSTVVAFSSYLVFSFVLFLCRPFQPRPCADSWNQSQGRQINNMDSHDYAIGGFVTVVYRRSLRPRFIFTSNEKVEREVIKGGSHSVASREAKVCLARGQLVVMYATWMPLLIDPETPDLAGNTLGTLVSSVQGNTALNIQTG